MSTRTPSTPPPSPPSPPATTPSPEGLARQLRLFKILALLLLAALGLGAGAFWYVRRMGQPVTVLLDGKPITTVRNYATANQLLDQAERSKVGPAFPEDSIVRLQKVQWRHVDRDVAIDADPVARRKLAKALKLHVRAFAILVGKRVSVGLPTSEDAADTLERVKAHFAQLPPATEVIGEPELIERVKIKEKSLDAAQVRSSPAQAAPYFWTPPPSRTYTVRRGDTGLVIARHNHLSLTDFIGANPTHNINRLSPGDVVNVQKMPLLLTVRVKKKMTREEKIVQGAPAYAAGRQAVTYAVTYINGQETGREALSAITIEPAHARTSL